MSSMLMSLEDLDLDTTSYKVKALFNRSVIQTISLSQSEALNILLDNDDFRRSMVVKAQPYDIQTMIFDVAKRQIDIRLVVPTSQKSLYQNHPVPQGLDPMLWNEQGKTEMLWVFSGLGAVDVKAKLNEAWTYSKKCSPIEFLRLFNRDGTLPRSVCFDDHPFVLEKVKFEISKNHAEIIVSPKMDEQE